MIGLLQFAILVITVSVFSVLGKGMTVDVYANVVELASEIYADEVKEEAFSHDDIRIMTTIVYIDGNPVEVAQYQQGFHTRLFSVDDLSRGLKAAGVDFDYSDFVDYLLTEKDRQDGQFVAYYNGSLYARVLYFERYLNIPTVRIEGVIHIDTERFPRHVEICLFIDGYRTQVRGYVELDRGPNRVHISLDDFQRELHAAGISFHVPKFEGLSYVPYRDIMRNVDFEMSMQYGRGNIVSRISSYYMLSIYTEPLVLSDEEKQAIVNFLLRRYPGLITGSSFYRNFEDVGRWYPGDYWISKAGDVLQLGVILMDVGSTAGLTYLYIDGEFRYIGPTRRMSFVGHYNDQPVMRWQGEYHFITFHNGEMVFTLAPNDIESRLVPARRLENRYIIDNVARQRLLQWALAHLFTVVRMIAIAHI